MFQVSLGLPGAVLSQCPLLKNVVEEKKETVTALVLALGKLVPIRKKLGKMSRQRRFWEIKITKVSEADLRKVTLFS